MGRCENLAKNYMNINIKVINVESDTFGNPILKGLTKLAIIPDYKRPWMLCLALQPGRKSGLILPFSVV